MQGLAVIAALILSGVGYARGGILGLLTGFVLAVGGGSGLAIAFAEQGTDVSEANVRMRRAQRLGGLVAALGCGLGAYYGGWPRGWLWGLGGYIVGIVAALIIGAATGALRPDANR